MEAERITECVMEQVTLHCLYPIKYHIVWLTKHRKSFLKGNIAKRTQAIIQTNCRKNEMEIIAGHVGEDHVHLLAAVPSEISVKRVVQQLKEETARELKAEYQGLKKHFWRGHLWDGGSFVVSSEQAENECIAKYIRAKC